MMLSEFISQLWAFQLERGDSEVLALDAGWGEWVDPVVEKDKGVAVIVGKVRRAE